MICSILNTLILVDHEIAFKGIVIQFSVLVIRPFFVIHSITIYSYEHHINRHIVKWIPLQDECVKLNIDGNCGASSDIGSSGLLCDNERDWISSFSSIRLFAR